MKKFVVVGLCVVFGVELLAIVLLDRRLVLWTTGVATAVVLVGIRWLLVSDGRSIPTVPPLNEPEKALRRWLSRTETMISWSESTRSDWDRHLRPILARQFEMATGQRQTKDPAAFHAAGRMLFGDELWGWVDPGNVARSGGDGPGPGRGALGEILQRLEQV